MRSFVSIIVRTWNALEYTRLCIELLLMYTRIPYELIIVDNGSTDGTRDFLESLDLSHIKIIYNPVNLGCIEANQQGYEASDGDLVCLLNNDVVVSDRWLKHLCEVLHDNWDRGARIVGPLQLSRTLKHPYQPSISSRDYWDQVKACYGDKPPSKQLSEFCGGVSYNKFVRDFIEVNDIGDVVLDCPPDFVSGSCLLVAKELIEEIGSLARPNLRFYGPDDVYLCWDAAKLGYLVMRTSRVYVHHFKHASVDANNFNRQVYLDAAEADLFQEWGSSIDTFLRNAILHGQEISEIISRYFLVGRYLQWKAKNCFRQANLIPQ